MSKLNINIGQSANDKSGDTIRAAFDKVNQNFTELYNISGINTGDLVFDGSRALYNPTSGGVNIWDGALNGPYHGEILLDINGITLATNNETRAWQLDNAGTLSVPAPFPRTFTAVLDTAHMTYPDPAVALDPMGSPWTIDVTFSIVGGAIETSIQNIFPILGNPGYVSNYAFSFTEADHGIPTYTFTIELQDVVLPGGAGWTANIAVSAAPRLPASITSEQTLVLHGTQSVVISNGTNIHEEQFKFTGRTLQLPASGSIVDSNGGNILAGYQYGTSYKIQWNDTQVIEMGGNGCDTIFYTDISQGQAAGQITANHIEGMGLKDYNGTGIFIEANNLKWHFLPDGRLTAPGTISAKNTLALETTNVDTLYGVYQDAIAQLDAGFAADEYTGQGYPADITSYDKLVRAKALNPIIPDIWITLAYNIRTAYFQWAAASVTLTVDPSGFIITTGSGTYWRFDEATGLRFPDNTYQNTAFVGSSLRLKSANGTYQLTMSNTGMLALPAGGDIVDSTGETVLGFASTTTSSVFVQGSNQYGVDITGDVTGTFSSGQVIKFSSIAADEFTIDTVTYDGGFNLTSITLVEGLGGPVDGDEIFFEMHGVTEIYPGDGIALGITESDTGRVLTIAAVIPSTLTLQAKPATSAGQVGDKQGMTAIDTASGDFYFCINDYTDGQTPIWSKVVGNTAWV
jgi:hypothetical protein